MDKISIIIPVYNAEKYLEKCLDSVINQTYKNIEIICVNDGSKDNSLKILEEYAKKDERIKIITQENKGVSVARNTGIKAVSGEYIMFVDSDDKIELNACELSLNKILENNSDICCFGVREIRNGKEFVRFWEQEIFEEYFDKELDINAKRNFLVNVCGKLFRGDFIKRNKIFFIENVKTGEDSIFNLCCLFNNPKYSLLNEQLYEYDTDIQSSASNNLRNVIVNDVYGFKLFFNMPIFKEASEEYKIIALEKFIGQLSWWYIHKTKKHRVRFYLQIESFKKYVYKTFSNELLKRVSNIGFLNEFNLRKWLISKVFSVKNSSNTEHKVLCILGIKIKFKRKNNG